MTKKSISSIAMLLCLVLVSTAMTGCKRKKEPLVTDTAIPAQPIDPPTISVTFGINDSPLAGKDGNKVQSRVIRDRLMKEAEQNVAIKIADTPGGDAFEVAGRGELQMGVLIENMRREGF